MPVDEGDEGAVLAILVGIGVPGPNGQGVMVPTGRYQVPMGKQAVLRLIDSLAAAADKLPDPKPQSNIVIAGQNDVDNVAQNLGRFTK
jgi:hypothetical protein